MTNKTTISKTEFNNEIKDSMMNKIINNASVHGWRIEKQHSNIYVLKKRICDLLDNEKNTENLIDSIFNIDFQY